MRFLKTGKATLISLDHDLGSLKGKRVSMRIEKLAPGHIPELFDFEKRNRIWFERFVPPRPDHYFSYETFSKAISDLLKEQESGKSVFFVLLDKERIIGRANITDIDKKKADIGYRVCQSAIGKGIASKAVSYLVHFAENKLKIKMLHAKTTTSNASSMRVLEKNKFIQTRITENGAVLNGVSLSFVHYIYSLNPQS